MKKLLVYLCVISLIICTLPIRISAVSQVSQKRIVLTFDDGPHPKQTRQILDFLDKYQIKATFFVIGTNVRQYPDVLREVEKRGHEIGNHTNTHSHAARLDSNTLEQQILDCEREIFLQSGVSAKLFRPPEGALNDQMRAIIRNLGYTNVLWNLDTLDWAHTPPEQIAEYVISNAKNGDIILMHDYIGYNSPTLEALELFVPELLEQGFTFVTVGELLALK